MATDSVEVSIVDQCPINLSVTALSVKGSVVNQRKFRGEDSG